MIKWIENIMWNIRDFGRSVLSDRSILKYNKKGLLIEGEISSSQVQPNSIDLTLGNTWKKIKSNCQTEYGSSINTRFEIGYTKGTFIPSPTYTSIDKTTEMSSCYILQPGEFILMASNEVLNIPNGIISFVQGRSSIARLGIQTEQAGLIDAGFKGTITFEVQNQGMYPIILYAGMRVAQVYFFKAQHTKHTYGSKSKGSKYQLQIEATGSKIYLDPELQK